MQEWLKRHKRWAVVMAVLSTLFIALPQIVSSWWSLFVSEPLFVWLARKGIPQLGFSPLWITGPIGSALLLTILLSVWPKRRLDATPKQKKVRPRDEEFSASVLHWPAIGADRERDDKKLSAILFGSPEMHERRERQVADLVARSVAAIRSNPQMFPLYALQTEGAGSLETNQQFLDACEMVHQRHIPHPLKGCSDFEVNWLELVRFANREEMSLSSDVAVYDCLQSFAATPIGASVDLSPTDRHALLVKIRDLVLSTEKLPLSERVDEIGALIRFSSEFKSERDVVWTCAELEQRQFRDPFKVLESAAPGIFEGRKLEFLRDARTAKIEIRLITSAISFVTKYWRHAEDFKKAYRKQHGWDETPS